MNIDCLKAFHTVSKYLTERIIFQNYQYIHEIKGSICLGSVEHLMTLNLIMEQSLVSKDSAKSKQSK